MEAKKILNQHRSVYFLIKDLKAQVKDIEAQIYGCSSGKLTGMPRGGKPVTREDMANEKADILKRIERLEIVKKQKKEIVQAYIDTVYSPRHNKILTMYYIKVLPIWKIAELEGYSQRHVFRLYEQAVEMVDVTLDL